MLSEVKLREGRRKHMEKAVTHIKQLLQQMVAGNKYEVTGISIVKNWPADYSSLP